MRLHRFYVKQPLGEEELVIEDRELVHQWSSVFRYKHGDSVRLFSLASSSFDYEYCFSSLNKKEASFVFTKKLPTTLPSKKAALYMALVKKDTFETIARQATELLITDIIPVVASRSEKKNLNLERLHTITKEAAEQCGRGDLPTLHPIVNFNEAVMSASASHVVYDTGAEKEVTDMTHSISAIWIGPEGGWTNDEVEILKEKGVNVLTLGSSVLKADTAAIVGMTRTFL